MMRVIAMKRLSLLPGILPAKVATAHLRDYQGNNRLTYTAAGVYDGSSPPPSISHKGGKNMDLRYLRTDYTGKQVLLEDKYFEVNPKAVDIPIKYQ